MRGSVVVVVVNNQTVMFLVERLLFCIDLLQTEIKKTTTHGLFDVYAEQQFPSKSMLSYRLLQSYQFLKYFEKMKNEKNI